jgi:hypothetical protein
MLDIIMKNVVILFLFAIIPYTVFAGIELAKRPQEIKKNVSEAYEKIRNRKIETTWQEKGHWPYYNLMFVQEKSLIDYAVKQALEKNEKMLRIMDFGSGLFKVPMELADYVKEKYQNESIHFEIYGVTGEIAYQQSQLDELQKMHSSHNVQLKLMQQTEIESIDATKEFADKSALIKIIFTRWTLTHLLDAMGALDRLHKLLTLGGMVLFDGFYLAVDNDLGKNSELFKALYYSNVKALSVRFGNQNQPRNQYVIQKISSDNPVFSLEYADSKDVVKVNEGKGSIRSGSVARYTFIEGAKNLWPKKYEVNAELTLSISRSEQPSIPDREDRVFYGDPELLKLLIDNKLFGESAKTEIKTGK